jgi:hypothetical protein
MLFIYFRGFIASVCEWCAVVVRGERQAHDRPCQQRQWPWLKTWREWRYQRPQQEKTLFALYEHGLHLICIFHALFLCPPAQYSLVIVFNFLCSPSLSFSDVQPLVLSDALCVKYEPHAIIMGEVFVVFGFVLGFRSEQRGKFWLRFNWVCGSFFFLLVQFCY